MAAMAPRIAPSSTMEEDESLLPPTPVKRSIRSSGMAMSSSIGEHDSFLPPTPLKNLSTMVSTRTAQSSEMENDESFLPPTQINIKPAAASRVSPSSVMDEDESFLPPPPGNKPLHHDQMSLSSTAAQVRNSSARNLSSGGCMKTSRRRRTHNHVKFSRRVQVFHVLSLSEYTDRELDDCWFTKEELAQTASTNPNDDSSQDSRLKGPQPSGDETKILTLQNEIQRLIELTHGKRSSRGASKSEYPSPAESKIMELQSEIHHLIQFKTGRTKGSTRGTKSSEPRKEDKRVSAPEEISFSTSVGSGNGAAVVPEFSSAAPPSSRSADEAKILTLQANIHKLLSAATLSPPVSRGRRQRGKGSGRGRGSGDTIDTDAPTPRGRERSQSPRRRERSPSPRRKARSPSPRRRTRSPSPRRKEKRDQGASKWRPSPKNDKKPSRPPRRRQVVAEPVRLSNLGMTDTEDRILALQAQIRKSMR